MTFDFENYLYEPIDLCACYEPMFEPPAEQVEEWGRQREAKLSNPLSCAVTRQIGNTWYIIETECTGSEALVSKVKRLIFSEKGAIC